MATQQDTARARPAPVKKPRSNARRKPPINPLLDKRIGVLDNEREQRADEGRLEPVAAGGDEQVIAQVLDRLLLQPAPLGKVSTSSYWLTSGAVAILVVGFALWLRLPLPPPRVTVSNTIRTSQKE